ncbi:MAG: alpha/beta hydrolase [Magnetovibrio sp.]|nr:alpha/beta hydrolase [Magnetovibrio sp.]
MSEKVYTEGRVSAQDGLGLYYRDYGPRRGGATPVLCLPGLTRNCRDFHAVAKGLMADRRVICPDIRGRGQSERDPNWRNYDPVVYISDFRHMLTALGLHRVFVIGTSMGGVLAMAMGAAMPTTIAGALINDVGPVIDDAGITDIIRYVERSDQVFGNWQDAADFLKSCFLDMPGMDNDAWLGAVRRTYRERPDGSVVIDWDPAIAKPLREQRRNADLWPLFRSLKKVPVLVVRGAVSDVLSAETLDQMADAIPGLATITVPGVGHAPTLAEANIPEALNDILDAVDRTGH